MSTSALPTGTTGLPHGAPPSASNALIDSPLPDSLPNDLPFSGAASRTPSAPGRARRDRKWLTPLQAGLAGGAIAIFAFGGGFGTAYAVAAATAYAQVPVVQLEMSDGMPGDGAAG